MPWRHECNAVEPGYHAVKWKATAVTRKVARFGKLGWLPGVQLWCRYYRRRRRRGGGIGERRQLGDRALSLWAIRRGCRARGFGLRVEHRKTTLLSRRTARFYGKTWLYHAVLPGDWLREDSLMTSRGSCITSFGLPDADNRFACAKFKSANFSANTALWVRGIMTKIVPYYMKNLLQGSVEGRFTCPLILRT